VAVVLVAGCTPPSSSGEPGTPSSTGSLQAGQPWAAGDSISTANSWPGKLPNPIASVAVAGRGFVVTQSGPTIGTVTLAAVSRYGKPSTVVIMGGVNDVKQTSPPTTAQITAAMASLDTALTSQGIRVVWATQPGWQHATRLAPLNSWIRSTRARVIDCASSISSWIYTTDGIHPNENGQQVLHACIRPRI
jgi:lysophospholipase L1-like esterase